MSNMNIKDFLVDVAYSNQADAEMTREQKVDSVFNLANPKHTLEHEALVSSAVRQLFTNHGELGLSKFDLMDIVTTTDLTRFIGDTITYIVREALEPNLMVVNNLFQEVRLEGNTNGLQIAIGSIGAAEAGIVPEGAEGRMINVNLAEGDMVTISVRKYGLDVGVTEEVLQSSQWDVLGIWLRAVGRSMARFKEKEAIKQLQEGGETVFSNIDPANSLSGNLTGRNISGSMNGSFTFNDMNTFYARGFMQGFTMDTLLIHPLAWAMWGTDPELKEIVVSGSRVATSPLPQGSFAPGWPDPFGGKGYRTKATGNSVSTTAPFYKMGIDPFATGYDPLGSTFYIPPRFLPAPLKVLVSHMVPYYSSGGKAGTTAGGYPAADVIMADSSRAGVIATKGGVRLSNFDDPVRDIQRMKIRESYGFAILEQGKGILIAKGAVIARNYVFNNVNQATLAELPPTAASGSGLVSV